MSLLIFALVLLVVIALLIYAVNAFLPIGATFKNLVCFILVLIGVILLAQRSGVF